MPERARIQKEFIYRQFENWLVRQVAIELDKRKGDLIAAFLKHDPSKVGPFYRANRFKKLEKANREIMREVYAEVRKLVNKNLLGLSESIAEQTVKELEKEAGI